MMFGKELLAAAQSGSQVFQVTVGRVSRTNNGLDSRWAGYAGEIEPLYPGNSSPPPEPIGAIQPSHYLGKEILFLCSKIRESKHANYHTSYCNITGIRVRKLNSIWTYTFIGETAEEHSLIFSENDSGQIPVLIEPL